MECLEENTKAAMENSKLTYDAEALSRNLDAKQSHNADLFKTQQPIQGNPAGDVMVLVKFPGFSDTRSCSNTTFRTAHVRLTRDQVLKTGSELLKEQLQSEPYQIRAKKVAGALPEGITHVLNLSPSTEEDDYTIALQCLSITKGIRLWYRSVTIGVSVAAVAGHDDSCSCNEQWDNPYVTSGPPESIQGKHTIGGLKTSAYLFDTESWSMDEYRDIKEYCPVRQGANVLRLFRSVVDNDLRIDSAPRLWTLVGLFGMFEMKNYDLLRDAVIAWFNVGNNFTFVELLPEETIRIATILNAPILSEPAFRILVNERALIIAGGKPSVKSDTIFGRRISDCLSGTEDTEEILQKIQHAGVAMAERYKAALDTLLGNDALSRLNIPEWENLLTMGDMIPDGHALLRYFNSLLDAIRVNFRKAVEHITNLPAADLPTNVKVQDRIENIEAALSYSIPKNELDHGRSFGRVYNTLNKAQRALCPNMWLKLRSMIMDDFSDTWLVRREARAFSRELRQLKLQGRAIPGSYPTEFDFYNAQYYDSLFQHALDRLDNYVEPLVSRSKLDFDYMITPHLVLCLNDHEMGYFRYDYETAYEAKIPEAELGPSGPGPSFHTGNTVASTDSVADGFDDLAIPSDDGAVSTVVGSVVVQDGNSTVYGRRQVLAQSASIASERFTDDAMGAEYAEAGSTAPAGTQAHAQALGASVGGLPESDEDDEDTIYEFSDDDSIVDVDAENDSEHDAQEEDDDLEVISHQG